MEKKTERRPGSHVLIYAILIVLAISIILPVAWVFMASIKQNSEFYQNPWALPQSVYLQNFADAWTKARMGDYMLNSVLVTTLALVLLLVIALPHMCSRASGSAAADCCIRLLWVACLSMSTILWCRFS